MSNPSQGSSSLNQASCSSSGHSSSTRPSQYSDYQDSQEEEEEVDPVWGMLVPLKSGKYETIHLIQGFQRFGRIPSCEFVFHKRKHGLNKIEFQRISKVQFTIRKNREDMVLINDSSSNGTYVNGVRLIRRQRVPLQNNAVISIAMCCNRAFVFVNRMVQRRERADVPNGFMLRYTLEDVVLGKGQYAVVKKGFKNDDYHEKVAVKIISKYDANYINKDAKYEFEIIKDLSHKNIIKIFDCFENSHYCYIVMEYIAGGDMCRYIRQNGAILEDQAKLWFKQMLESVEYLHSKNVIHRDLKPENILLCEDEENVFTLKVADFGLSRFLSEGSSMRTYAGTSVYRAPEILTSYNGYTKTVDVWSLGCLLYVMLVGTAPFKPDMPVNERVLKDLFTCDEWKTFSLEVQNLGRQMLTIDSGKRISIKEASKHEWFNVVVEKPSKPSAKRQRIR